MDFREFKAQVATRYHIPRSYISAPEQVADLVAILVSDESVYITGLEIDVNGEAG